MNYVVALMDEHTCRTYRRLEDVPKSARATFVSAAGLIQEMSIVQMDAIRGKILGELVESSPTPEVAASRLWHAFGIGADAAEGKETYPASLDDMGNRRTQSHDEIELVQLIWEPGKDWAVDMFVKKLPPQARAMLDILVQDGRGIWTAQQMLDLMKQNEHLIKTKQGAARILKYYRPEMLQRKMLKRVSFAEFAAKQEFKGLTPVDGDVPKVVEPMAPTPEELG